MKWKKIDKADLEGYVATDVLAGLIGPEGERLLYGVIYNVTQWIRAEIRSAKIYPMCGDEETLPKELKHAACVLVLEALYNRVGRNMNPTQRNSVVDARKLVERVSKRALQLSSPFNERENSAKSRKIIDLVSGRVFDASNLTVRGL